MSHVKRSLLTGSAMLLVGAFSVFLFGPGANAEQPSTVSSNVVSVQEAPAPDAAVAAMLVISAG